MPANIPPVMRPLMLHMEGFSQCPWHLAVYGVLVVVAALAPIYLRVIAAVLLLSPLYIWKQMMDYGARLKFPPLASYFIHNTLWFFSKGYFETFAETVMQNCKEGDPDSVIKAVDDFCWKQPTMNVGDVKGKILDEAVMQKKPKVVCELGSFLGYSTVRIARLLDDKARLHSVDPSALGLTMKCALVSVAGLSSKVTNFFGFSDAFLKQCAEDGTKIDLLFIDHVKELYLADLKLAIDLGVLAPGAMVVADNVLTPGAPDYKEWILSDEGKKLFTTEVKRTLLEYSKTVPDEVLISILK